MSLTMHHHGKSRVRLGRVWREGNVHTMVEWTVHTMLDSAMEKSFLHGDNTGMTATDTQKNMVYVIGQRMSRPCSPEEYGIALAKAFIDKYPLVSKAKVLVEEQPWRRVVVDGAPHEHGFSMEGTAVRTAYVTVDRQGRTEVTSGVKDLKLLKTTQSGYEGFLHDQYTLLPDVKDRIMASSVTATWTYAAGHQPPCFQAAYRAALAAMAEQFFGPPRGGVYSPAVQTTLFNMGKGVLAKVPQAERVFLNMPNLHFLPCTPVVGSKFNNDVYVATSEPHGNIEAVVSRTASKL